MDARLLLAGVCGAIAVGYAGGRLSAEPTSETAVSETTAPRGDIRVIYHSDGNMFRNHLPFKPKPEDLHEFVDHLARGGVDVLSQLCFLYGDTLYQSQFASPLFSRYGANDPGHVHLETLWGEGVEPIAVYAKRCHEKGMKYLSKLRMNDRHGRGKLSGEYSVHLSPFMRAHQEWWLKAHPGGLDYTHQGVRDWMFNIAAEVTGKFDIDGLTFNYMRYPYVFEPEESRAKQPILTEFMRRVRRMLDEEGKKKGKEMLFCVIVAPTLGECHDLGLDVPTWIREGIVDLVCPSDWGSCDFDAPYEEFARLTRKGDCRLFPMVHPYPERDRYERILMSVPAYRGLVKNFYAEGADGLGAFNYMYHWSGFNGWGYVGDMENYPKAFGTFAKLRDPDKLGGGDRHYISYPIHGYFGLRDRTKKIVLSRTEKPAFQRYVLRAAEDWTGKEKAILRFVAVGLVGQDEITVKFNGKVVPEKALARTHHPDGRQGLNEGADLDAYTTCEFVPVTPPEEPTRQVLEIALTKGAPDAGDEPIVVPEIEVAVAAGGGDPAEVMQQTRFHPKPQPELLAGHHPEHILLWAEVKAAGQMSGAVGEGAIPFDLNRKARVRAVDLAMQPSDAGACPREGDVGGITATLQRDVDGKPEGKPVSDGATVDFFPWKQSGGLTIRLQGYYKFAFPEPPDLDAGRYWLTLKRMPGGGDYCYYVFVHVGDENHVGEWFQNGKAMDYWTFFGVHGDYLQE